MTGNISVQFFILLAVGISLPAGLLKNGNNYEKDIRISSGQFNFVIITNKSVIVISQLQQT